MDEFWEANQAALWLVFVVFLRTGAVLALMPGLGEQSIPLRIRVSLAVGLSLAISPMLSPIGMFPTHWNANLIFFLSEPLAGLVLGIGLRAFVFALQIAGTIAAQATSLSQLLGGETIDPSPAIGRVLMLAGLTLALILDVHIHLMSLILLSYEVLPAGEFPTAARFAEWGVDHLARAFSLGFQLAGPFVGISLIYHITLGVINRAMPQLMVVFVGAPAITAGSLLLMVVLTPVLLTIWWTAFHEFLINPFDGAQ